MPVPTVIHRQEPPNRELVALQIAVTQMLGHHTAEYPQPTYLVSVRHTAATETICLLIAQQGIGVACRVEKMSDLRTQSHFFGLTFMASDRVMQKGDQIIDRRAAVMAAIAGALAVCDLTNEERRLLQEAVSWGST